MSLKANKALGQHFLRDENIAEQIVHEFTSQLSGEKILEIGPGQGVLTKHLLQFSQDLTCVEIDGRMAEYIGQTYPLLKGKIIREDFLKSDLDEAPVSIIGNFPYNISSQILFKVLENKEKIPLLVGMFQKEVAKRICSAHGNKDYGILSVLVQAFYNAEYLFDVSAECFAPPPKVKSGVIRLKRKKEASEVGSEEYFFRLVKAAFNQRRKTLRNALSALVPEKEKRSGKLFDKRAEQLSVGDFIQLSNQLQP